MEIAAAQPDIPWTDLAYSLQPNGHTLDYVADAPYLDRTATAIGVMKQSFVAGLYATGLATQQLRAAGHRPRRRPRTLVRADQRRRALRRQSRWSHDIVDELTTHHSSYYIDDSIAPGAAADLERLDRRPLPARRGDPLLQPHPHQPPRRADLADLQRPRPPARPEQGRRRRVPQRPPHAWFDHYVKGTGAAPVPGRPDADPDLRRAPPAAPPARSTTRRRPPVLGRRPGRARARARSASATRPSRRSRPAAGDPAAGQAFDPIAGGGACATASRRRPARRRQLPPRPGARRRLHADGLADGRRRRSPRPGPTSQLAARLLDVAPERRRDPRRARPLPARDRRRADPPGLPAAPERLALRGRARRQARAAAGRRALRPRLQRPGARSPSPTSSCACRCSSRPTAGRSWSRPPRCCRPDTSWPPDTRPARAAQRRPHAAGQVKEEVQAQEAQGRQAPGQALQAQAQAPLARQRPAAPARPHPPGARRPRRRRACPRRRRGCRSGSRGARARRPRPSGARPGIARRSSPKRSARSQRWGSSTLPRSA